MTAHTRRLLLLRHGEAEPARAGLADAERTLTERGRQQALDAAQCLRRTRLRIDHVWVSPAVRTCETALIIAAELDMSAPPHQVPTLYLATVTSLLEMLQRCDDDVRTLLLIGHNPGLSELARTLQAARSADTELGTGGLCRLELELSAWGSLSAQSARSCSVLH